LLNEGSANPGSKPTDDFLRKVKEKEDEAAQASQNSLKENPMGEEHLRLQAHNNDPDQMKLLHSYYTFKRFSRCKDCGVSLFTQESMPKMTESAKSLVEDFDELMPNGAPASSRYKHYKGWDGAGRTAALLAAGLRRLEAGQPDVVIKAFFYDCGITVKASDYVAICHEMKDGNDLYKVWKKMNQPQPGASTNGH
jgi:hypothetical protein